MFSFLLQIGNVGARYNCLNKAVVMSAHSLCFLAQIRYSSVNPTFPGRWCFPGCSSHGLVNVMEKKIHNESTDICWDSL